MSLQSFALELCKESNNKLQEQNFQLARELMDTQDKLRVAEQTLNLNPLWRENDELQSHNSELLECVSSHRIQMAWLRHKMAQERARHSAEVRAIAEGKASVC